MLISAQEIASQSQVTHQGGSPAHGIQSNDVLGVSWKKNGAIFSDADSEAPNRRNHVFL